MTSLGGTMGKKNEVRSVLWLGLILSLGTNAHSWKKPIQLPTVNHKSSTCSSCRNNKSSDMERSILSKKLNTPTEIFIATSFDDHMMKSLEIRGGASDDDEGEDSPIVSKVFSLLSSIVDTISSIMNAIFPSSAESDASDDTQTTFRDFGTYLSHAYGCAEEDIDEYDDDDDDDAKGEESSSGNSIRVEGGSITNALLKARSKARLLVVYIPASKPPKKKSKKNTSYDQKAITSIRSSIVKAAADKKAKKKEDYGSFMFWSTKVDSSEASTAMKRLKVKPSKKTKSSPLLVVVYPYQTFDTLGNPKIVPKVLAQHHCNPPPSPKSLSSWLDSLRKRHGKQYTAMQTELREIAFMKECTKGYESSMKQDRERVEKEREEKERKLEEERLRKEKEEALKERRKSLLESLPEEPDSTGSGIITIALRFGDGRSGQRRFSSDSEMEAIFNWVDAIFEMERETVVLTTMNGQTSYLFEDTQEGGTLDDAGLGRLVAFRVSTKEVDDGDEVEDTNTGDDYDDEDEEDLS